VKLGKGIYHLLCMFASL